MQQSVSIQIRVNGVPIQQVRLRGPQNSRKLVIVDPVIGSFEIDDRDQRFHIEVLDLDIPTELRATLPNGGWKQVSARALMAMLSGATNDSAKVEDGDRCSWVHGSDLAEVDGLRADSQAIDLGARRALRKAARVLYNSGIPYLHVGEYQLPEEATGCTDAALIIVPDAQRAHQLLCANGFEPHPASVNSVICAACNFEVYLVPGTKPKRKRQ